MGIRGFFLLLGSSFPSWRGSSTADPSWEFHGRSLSTPPSLDMLSLERHVERGIPTQTDPSHDVGRCVCVLGSGKWGWTVQRLLWGTTSLLQVHTALQLSDEGVQGGIQFCASQVVARAVEWIPQSVHHQDVESLKKLRAPTKAEQSPNTAEPARYLQQCGKEGKREEQHAHLLHGSVQIRSILKNSNQFQFRLCRVPVPGGQAHPGNAIEARITHPKFFQQQRWMQTQTRTQGYRNTRRGGKRGPEQQKKAK